jgi:hypothetical protein
MASRTLVGVDSGPPPSTGRAQHGSVAFVDGMRYRTHAMEALWPRLFKPEVGAVPCSRDGSRGEAMRGSLHRAASGQSPRNTLHCTVIQA